MSSEQNFDDQIELEAELAEATESKDGTAVQARLVALEAENERLRQEYSRTKRTHYRRTALGLIVIGLLAIGGGFLFLESREVLFALGGTGVFAGFLTFYLTPEQFIPADVGERVYAALAGNEAALVADLGLSSSQVYLPDPTEGSDAVRLFIPQHSDYVLPPVDAYDSVIVVTDAEREQGLLLDPTGGELYDAFEWASSGSVGEHPTIVVEKVTDALVEQFELVDTVRVDVDAADGRASVGVKESVYGPVDQFDHPVVSLLAVGLARQLNQPIEVVVDEADDARVDALVTCQWDTQDTHEGVSDDAPGETAETKEDADSEYDTGPDPTSDQ